ncbi:hypothetical protein [Paraburkholderia sp. GAS334]|uniref:hypothetical protein n=1 Tax=Paraburkholderia sp. GAS334 TaxID=3035131 RepID=UPI003D1BCFA3
MSTIPLTLIEGAMALPRVRPFASLPHSFGREWALLPPNVSFRVELKALYAAMLRTFCLSVEAIRTACRWEPLKVKPVAGGLTAEGGLTSGVSVPTGASAGPVHATPVDLLIAPDAPQSSSRKRMLLGGACAASGAAVLAWIALSTSHSHLADRRTQDGAKDDMLSSSNTPSRPTSMRSDDIGSSAAAASASTGRQAAATETIAASAATSTAAKTARNAPATTATRASATNTAVSISAHEHPVETARSKVKPSRTSMRDATSASIAKLRKADQRVTSHVTRTARQSATSKPATPSGLVVASTRRSNAVLSAAGRFSPHPATTTAIDDYASIKTWAATHTGDATSPRASASANSNADWMDSMTQRRVTEVPERFSK